MKILLRAAFLVALVAASSGCAHMANPPPECHGTAVPINSTDIQTGARP